MSATRQGVAAPHGMRHATHNSQALMSRAPTVPPGPESRDIGPIARWSPDRKLLTAALYGAQAAPPEVSKVLMGLFTPEAIGITVAVFGVWAASHAYGAGEAADIGLLVIGVIALGAQSIEAAAALKSFVEMSLAARTDEDLHAAGAQFARAAAIVGSAVLVALIFRAGGKLFGYVRSLAVASTEAELTLMVDRLLVTTFGSVKNVGQIPRENVRLIAQFLNTQEYGFSEEKIAQVLKGIDLHTPVKIDTLQPGEILGQYINRNRAAGSWFVRAGSGISHHDVGLAKGDRFLQYFRVNQPIKALISRAAATADSWTPGRKSSFPQTMQNTAKSLSEAAKPLVERELVGGGGTQLFIPNAQRFIERFAPSVPRASGAGLLGGMTNKHFNAFIEAAKETRLIVAVRNTNRLSTPLIERGFPPKPMQIKIKTSKTTGIVTAANPKDVDEAFAGGFHVVDAHGVIRNAAGEAIKLPVSADWPLESGQVIHPTQLKPLVGDYDLLSVIDPNAPGRNLVLAASDGQILDNWSNPLIKRVAEAVNQRLDQARVMHGAHDGFRKGSPDFSDLNDGATVFFPDGTTSNLASPSEIRAFFRAMNRKTVSDEHF